MEVTPGLFIGCLFALLAIRFVYVFVRASVSSRTPSRRALKDAWIPIDDNTDLVNWELEEIEDRLKALNTIVQTVQWRLRVGPLILRLRFDPGQLASLILNAYLLIGLLGGALVIWSKPPWNDLGSALVAGVIFGLAAFGISWWEKNVDIVTTKVLRAETPARTRLIQDLQKTHDRLVTEWERRRSESA